MDRSLRESRSTAHARHPSDLSTDFSRLNTTTLLSDPTRFQSPTHLRHMSNIDSNLSTARRGSYQSDTTSRQFDREARSIRVRTSDIFGVKPNLKFRDNIHYRPMPDGHLPTLKGQPKTTFVDQIADELDTRQLRNVLDTDSRRRKRRQSAIEGARRQHQSIASTRRSVSGIVARSAPLSRDPAVEVIQTAPVFDKVLIPVQGESNGRSMTIEQKNLITGKSDHWHEVDGTEVNGTNGSGVQAEPGLILAGNRESFPDFAILDRRDPVRESNTGGFLTTAWTSLWRRASTARTRKEHDVAQHRTKTLLEANKMNDTSDRFVAVPQTITDGARLDKHLSAGSSILYETLDDLPKSSIPAPSTQKHLNHISQAIDVPTDAFYDPRTTGVGTTSRATHSRNFSRPTNDSRQDTYGRTIDQQLRSVSSASQNKSFSPLLNGDSFPRPDERRAPSTLMSSSPPSLYSAMVSKAYKTPAEAAGLIQPSWNHESIPFISTAQAFEPRLETSSQISSLQRAPEDQHRSTEGEAMVLNGEHSRNEHKEPSKATGAFSNTSIQQKEYHKSAIDDVSIDGRHSRPLSARSLARNVPSIAATSYQVDNGGLARRMSTDDTDSVDEGSLESPVIRELEDESDYEQGIWRTGIGKPVQIVNTAGENGPILVERSQLISSIPSSRRSSDTRRSTDDSRLKMSRVESHRGELDTDENHELTPTTERAPPPPLVQHESYMTSVNSFYTADGFLSNESAASSRETLTQQHFV